MDPGQNTKTTTIFAIGYRSSKAAMTFLLLARAHVFVSESSLNRWDAFRARRRDCAVRMARSFQCVHNCKSVDRITSGFAPVTKEFSDMLG